MTFTIHDFAFILSVVSLLTALYVLGKNLR